MNTTNDKLKINDENENAECKLNDENDKCSIEMNDAECKIQPTKLKMGKGNLKFNDFYLKRTLELSACLLLECQIYEALDISHDTFYKWKRTYPEFAEALKKGRSITLEKLTKKAVERSENDSIMLMFLLKNKGKFLEHHQDKNIQVKKKEIIIRRAELNIKEKEFKLKNEKFASDLAEKFHLNKEEVLELIQKNNEIANENLK